MANNTFPNLSLISHPLIAHKLTVMRKRSTTTRDFRTLLYEISLLMGYELTRDLPLTHIKIETPVTSIPSAPILNGKKLVIVPILRAGLAMVDGLLDLVPGARVGHIGLYRDEETKQAIQYMIKLPKLEGRQVIIADPMLATGNSMIAAVDLLKERGVPGKAMKVLSLVAAPEGVKKMQEKHKDVHIYTAALDEKLDENAYIVPGLGDAGDRIFGTK